MKPTLRPMKPKGIGRSYLGGADLFFHLQLLHQVADLLPGLVLNENALLTSALFVQVLDFAGVKHLGEPSSRR